MSLAVAVALCTIIGVPLGVLGLVLIVKQQAREQAAARAAEKQATYNEGVEYGKTLRQPPIDLLTSQLTDARRERDNERAERLDAEKQVRDLEAELRRKDGH